MELIPLRVFMRKCIFTAFIALTFILMSCSPDIDANNQKPEQLRVISNVDSIQDSTAVSRTLDDRIGDPLVGVMLRYTSAGPYEDKKPVDDETFTLYCIFRTATNGDGMEFNYILFVPECIKTEYEAVTQKSSAGLGNAFWWYMRNYLDMSLSEIKSDWLSALRILLESDNLPYPDRNDFPQDKIDDSGNLLKQVDNLFI